ncbi:MAG: archaeosortase/exosortase family protein [Acidobacteria bacterium]|nr:archaeosortase/exosortase family protein [Acidobacteriota bacterium]
MTATLSSVGAGARWRSEPGVRAVAARTAAAAALVLVAYHTSLWSLLRGVTVDTPLAYLGLVPIIAAALGYALARPAATEPEIHDRMVDRIVGIPLVAAALFALILLPPRLSVVYWLWRIDLLTMPLFVAGVVTLLFGVRMLWRTKAAVAFLFLAWPMPARWAVSTLLDHLSDLTAGAVRIIVSVVPLATPVVGDDTSFVIPHGVDGFRVQIASACSGANGLVGFLLVAGAVSIALRGGRLRKMAWLLTGSVLMIALNIVRILLILFVGRFAGETASIDVLHPGVGLVTFNLGVLAMVLVAHRFGLHLPQRNGVSRTSTVLRAVPTARRALLVLIPVAVLAGVFDHGLTRYDPIASSVGTPRLAGFARSSTDLDGFSAEPVATFQNGKRFFGEDSSWVRFSYGGYGTTDLRSDVPVLADVINTSNLQSFSDFGLEACYQFHGYGMQDVRRVDLGSGVTGTVLRWQDPANGLAWTTLYWIWAVRQGTEIRYERVVLLLNEVDGAGLVAPEVTEDAADEFAFTAEEVVQGRLGTDLTQREVDLRSFIVTFGRRVVAEATDFASQLPEAREPGQ